MTKTDCNPVNIRLQCLCHSSVKSRKVDWLAMKMLLVLSMMATSGFGQTIQVHGHRGARGLRPENTMPAFEYAIAQGVDALELDMAVTRDGVVVVSHDPELRAPIC